MKTERIFFEASGIILAIVGAFLLISSLMPLINPGFVKASYHEDPSFSTGNIVGLIIAILIIVCGFLCSRKASKLKKLESAADQKTADKIDKPD